MSFAQFPETEDGITLLQRSLSRQRVGHAYLFSGDDLGHLQAVARTLAKTLNCQNRRSTRGAPDCCDTCASCKKIEAANRYLDRGTVTRSLRGDDTAFFINA